MGHAAQVGNAQAISASRRAPPLRHLQPLASGWAVRPVCVVQRAHGRFEFAARCSRQAKRLSCARMCSMDAPPGALFAAVPSFCAIDGILLDRLAACSGGGVSAVRASSSSHAPPAPSAPGAQHDLTGTKRKAPDGGSHVADGPSSSAQPRVDDAATSAGAAAPSACASGQRRRGRRVTFAEGPLELTRDGHPPEGAAPAPVCLSGGACGPQLEGLTKANLLALERELGEEWQEANALSITRLKRRVRFAASALSWPARALTPDPRLTRV